MTSMLADMLKSSLSNFASQLKSNSGGQEQSVSTQNVTSDQEKEPSDHDDRSEGGDLASDEDPIDIPGHPKLENLMMTEEEEKDFETFALASPNVSKREYKVLFSGPGSSSGTSQAHPLVSQALACD